MAEDKSKSPVERVVVDIYGTSYPLRTDNPKLLLSIASELDQMMRKTAKSGRALDDRTVAVLTALQIAEDYHNLKKDYEELVELLNEK